MAEGVISAGDEDRIRLLPGTPVTGAIADHRIRSHVEDAEAVQPTELGRRATWRMLGVAGCLMVVDGSRRDNWALVCWWLGLFARRLCSTCVAFGRDIAEDCALHAGICHV